MSEPKIFMKGGGYYSANTVGAKHVIDRAGDLVFEYFSAENVSESERPFSVVDYGAADGGTSIDLMSRIVEAVRKASPKQEVSVTYTDLPHNDFSSLFRMLHGQIPEVTSYLKRFSDVFVSCSGTTFYKQILPSATVDVGFSATAMHWLSNLPGRISNHVHATGAVGDEWQTFRDYAMADWETILLHRSKEMKSGALLVMANFCIDEQGRYLGNTRGANMFDTFYRLWLDLAAAGVITEAECEATAFPQFYKTIEEYRLPFDDPDSAVSKSGLVLEKIYTGVTDCPYRTEFDRQGDPVAFADAYVPTLRSWSENVFFNGLDFSRSVEERRSIVEQFYSNYNSLVRTEPSNHSMDYVHVYMVARKL